MLASRALALLALALAACAPAGGHADQDRELANATCGEAPDALAGLVLRDRKTAPVTDGSGFLGSGHLGDVATASDGRVYVAASTDQLLAAQLLPGEGISLTQLHPVGGPDHLMCSALAVHEPSKTLFCGNADSRFVNPSRQDADGYIAAYSLENPGSPVLRDPWALRAPTIFAKDLHVQDSRLYVAQFGDGLWSAAIAPDGRLVSFKRAELEGAFVGISGAAGRLVALSPDRGLLVLKQEATGLVETGRLALEGPPIDLHVRGELALASLGSEGVAVVNVGGAEPRLVEQVKPRCLAVSADVSEDGRFLAVACLSGVYLYELGGERARPAGYHPSVSSRLAVRFVGADLFAPDWTTLDVFEVRAGGHAVRVDAPLGVYVKGDAPFTIAIRNPSDIPLQVGLRSDVALPGAPSGQVTIPPGEDLRFELAASVVNSRSWSEPPPTLEVESWAPGGAPAKACTRRFDLTRRWLGPVTSGEVEVPGVGHALTPFSVASTAGVQEVPRAGVATRVFFFTPGCVGLWPSLQDLVWRARSGRLPDGSEIAIVGRESLEPDDAPRRWGYERFLYGHTDPRNGPPELAARNGAAIDALWNGIGPVVFGGPGMGLVADVDEQRIVRRFEPMDRGAYSLP